MRTPRELADRLDEAAATLATAAHRVGSIGPGPAAFGLDGPGRLAEVGRILHEQWLVATGARSYEAMTAAARVEDVATALRAAAAGYADTDQAARRRQPEEP